MSNNSNEQTSSSSPAAAVASVPPGFLYWTPQIAAAMSLSGAPTQALAPSGVPREADASPSTLPMPPMPMMMMYPPSYYPANSYAVGASAATGVASAVAPAESSSESKQDDSKTPTPKEKKQPRKKDEDEEWNPAAERRQKKRRKTSEPEEKPEEKPKKKKRGFGTDKYFDEMYEKLLEFKAEHGHCVVPTKPRTPLGAWVATQRYNYRLLKKGERSSMNAVRLMKLTEAGFVFYARSAEVVTWEERIEACKKFKVEHGHLRIPTSHPELGMWVRNVRADYMREKTEGKQTPLNAERQAQLEELGFVWLVGNRQSKEQRFNKKTWDERVEEFKQYKATHGHPYVPQHLPEPKGLGGWVAKVRMMHKRMMEGKDSSMTTEKALQLTNLGFAWDASHINKTPGDDHDVDEEGDDGYSTTL